jgi:two-component SAPR family response regulator
LYEELGDELRVAWLHHDIGVTLRFHGDPRAEDHFRQALAYWRKTHNTVGLATTLNSIGVGYHQAGNYAQAIGALEEARVLARQIGHRRNEAYALASLGDVYRDQGEHACALEVYRQVLDIAEQLDGFILTYALNALGEIHYLLDDANSACDYLERAMKVAQSHQANYEIGLVETTLGICILKSGDGDDAIKRLNRAVKLLSTIKRDRVRARLHLAQAYFLKRQYDQVRSQLEAIAAENPTQAAIAVPFIFADQKQLQSLITYAVSKRISDNYYAPVLEKFKEREGQRACVRRAPRLIVHVRAFGHAHVYLGSERELVTQWKTDLVKQLFFLLLAYPDGLTTEEIVELLWVDKRIADPINNFHTTKSRLCKAIPNCVKKEHDVYVLASDIELHSDVAEFETLIQSARTTKTDSERLQAYERAIPLYQGDYFEDCYSDWCMGIRDHLRQMYLDALLAAAKIKEQRGDLMGARALYQDYLEEDRDREDVCQMLMRLQARMGDRVGAMKTYRRYVQVLQKDLEIPEPSRETVELYTQITKGEIKFAPAE